jgi:hypothetical protein
LGPRKKIADLDHDQSETGKHAVEKSQQRLMTLDFLEISGAYKMQPPKMGISGCHMRPRSGLMHFVVIS